MPHIGITVQVSDTTTAAYSSIARPKNLFSANNHLKSVK